MAPGDERGPQPSPPRGLRIAIVGTRGIPANYGGFETFAGELGTRLAGRGHAVTVIGRTRWVGPSRTLSPGLSSRNVVSLRGKYTETVSAAALSCFLLGQADVALFCNAATAPLLPLTWLSRTRPRLPVAMNVDGLEWQRAKWNRLGSGWYHVGEAAAARFADVVVADAEVVADYWRSRFPAVRQVVIPYGSSLSPEPDPQVLRQYGLEQGEYCLYVSRFEPENNPELVLRAFLASDQPRPLVMLGSAAYDHALQARVEALAASGGKRVRLLGTVYGQPYRSLQAGAALYVHATSVGGTHPALVEAMSTGSTVLCLWTPENKEVLGECGLFFRDEEGLRLLLSDPTLPDGQLGDAARKRQLAHYDWDQVTTDYERLLTGLAR